MRFIRSGTFADDAGWVASEHDDPGEVAAAYAQQQLVAAIRRKAGRNVTAADVAHALGRDRTDRTVLEMWTGRRAISMRMWFALALAYDLDPLDYCDPEDRRTLLPPTHRPWLGLWQPGDGPPRFRSPAGPGGEPSWIHAAQGLSAWIDEEDTAGRLRLADTRVAMHAVVAALAEAGLPVDLVSDPSPRVSRTRLVYETEPTIEIAVQLIPDSPLINRELLRGVLVDLHELAHSTPGRALAVLLAARRSLHRLDAFVPGWMGAVTVGESIRVPISAVWPMPASSGELLSGELTVTTLAVDYSVNGFFVVFYELHKDGSSV